MEFLKIDTNYEFPFPNTTSHFVFHIFQDSILRAMRNGRPSWYPSRTEKETVKENDSSELVKEDDNSERVKENQHSIYLVLKCLRMIHLL